MKKIVSLERAGHGVYRLTGCFEEGSEPETVSMSKECAVFELCEARALEDETATDILEFGSDYPEFRDVMGGIEPYFDFITRLERLKAVKNPRPGLTDYEGLEKIKAETFPFVEPLKAALDHLVRAYWSNTVFGNFFEIRAAILGFIGKMGDDEGFVEYATTREYLEHCVPAAAEHQRRKSEPVPAQS